MSKTIRIDSSIFKMKAGPSSVAHYLCTGGGLTTKDVQCVKSVRIWSFSGPNAGKYGPEKLRLRILFTEWYL